MKRKAELFFYCSCIIILINSILIAQEPKIVGVPALPMRYLDENNILQGFDIEVIDYIFKQQLGL